MDWNELANTNIADVERPPVRPAGHYSAIISGIGEQGASSKKGTLFIKFPIQVQEALEDVDAAELAASGGANFKSDLTFYLTQNSLYRFTEFGKGMGASDDLNVLELAEWLASCGEPFVVEGRHEISDKNPDQTFFRTDNAIPLSTWNERQSS